MSKTNCVVVPVYKEFSQLTIAEVKSFEQLLRVLGRHDIVIITFEGIGYDKYLEFAIRKSGKNLFVKLYDSEYFENLTGYNKLLTSKKIYLSLKEYKYMLIYQLDAWIFRDELEYWCSKGYDYIGAPWFERNTNNAVVGGNGGFSLRNVQKSLRILSRVKTITRIRRIWFNTKLQGIFSLFKISIFRSVFHIKDINYFNEIIFNWSKENEDYFWSYFIQNTFSDFSVAPFEEAFKFSFEVNSSFLFERNGCVLPFGCHAWEKYEPEFWKEYIRIDG